MNESARLYRHRLRSLIDVAVRRLGLLTLCERSMRRGLTVLMYHRVLPEADCEGYPLESLVIPEDAFASQMQFLAGHCTALPFSQAVDRLLSGNLPDRPLVAVTFDDGYADNFQLAAPILNQLNLKATFFVTSDFVASARPMWFDQAAVAWLALNDDDRQRLLNPGNMPTTSGRRISDSPPSLRNWMEMLKQLPVSQRDDLISMAQGKAHTSADPELYRPMTPQQLLDLHRQGHEVAAHTVHHPILTLLNDDDLRSELLNSRQQLEQWIGSPVTGFCYPNGSMDARVERAVHDAGYHYACTTESGLNLPHTVRKAPLRLSRLAMTMQRTVRPDGSADLLGFRAELCRLREWLR